MLGQEEQQATIDAILAKFNGRMDLVLLEVQRLMNKYFMEVEVTKLSSLQFDVIFNQMLLDAGYYSLVNEMIDVDYNDLFSEIKKGFALGGFNIEYSTNDVAIIQALKAVQENAFSVVASTSGSTLRQNLYRYSLSNFTVDQMAEQIAKDFEGTSMVRYSKTLANTAISEYQQSVIDVKAEDLDGVWLYVGVEDSLNRDFCACILDQEAYYDTDTKNDIQSDKRRRYNCRHRLRMVTEDYAIGQGYTFRSSSSC